MKKRTKEIIYRHDIQIEGSERVIFASEKEVNNQSFGRTMLILTGFVIWIISINVVQSIELLIVALLAFPGIIYWRYRRIQKVLELLGTETIRYVLVTNKRIVTSDQTYKWSQILRVVSTNYLGNECVVLQLNSGEIEFHSRISDTAFILENDFIFLNSGKVTKNLYNKIIPVWEEQPPGKIFLGLEEFLETSYQLTEIPNNEELRQFEGSYKGLELQCSYKNQFPFKEFSATINLPEEVTAYLKIEKQSKTDTFKQFFGKEDVIVYNPDIDNHYWIVGSHQEQIQAMFTKAVKDKIYHLISAGVCTWHFGQPGKIQKALPSTYQDNEAVLDALLVEAQSENRNQQEEELMWSKTLTFQIEIDESFQNEIDSIRDVLDAGLGLSIEFALAISRFSNE